jgi:exonuclease III
MTGITTYLSVLTVNVNGLNSPIKRHCLMNWIKNEDPKICCLQENHLNDRNKHTLTIKGWKKIYQANGPPKQAGVAICISDKVDFKLTLIKQDKEGESILIKVEIDQKEITIINQYVPNVNTPNFIKYTLKDLKAYINSNNTEVVGDFNSPLSSKDRSSKQKINKEILHLKYTTDQKDLVDVYRTFHPASTQYTFFSATLGTFSKIDHILGHKASLRKYKKPEIKPCILSDHNAIKLELNNKSKDKKHANSQKVNNSLLKNNVSLMK